MTTIFVRPGHEYDSYTDYWRLVELAGYPIIGIDAIDPRRDDVTYILTMLNLGYMAANSGGWPDAKARIIYWDLEWHDVSYKDVIPGVSEWWTSDRWYAQQRSYEFVPLGSHPHLVSVNPTRRWRGGAVWDVSVLAYMQPPRRHSIYNKLNGRALRMAPNSAWGHEREQQLEESRCMLHIHQHDEFPCVAAQRFALAASAAIPLVSETMLDPFPLVAGEDYIEANHDDLVGATMTLLHNDQGRDLAASLHHRLCSEYRFDNNVERALAGQGVFA